MNKPNSTSLRQRVLNMPIDGKLEIKTDEILSVENTLRNYASRFKVVEGRKYSVSRIDAKTLLVERKA